MGKGLCVQWETPGQEWCRCCLGPQQRCGEADQQVLQGGGGRQENWGRAKGNWEEGIKRDQRGPPAMPSGFPAWEVPSTLTEQ